MKTYFYVSHKRKLVVTEALCKLELTITFFDYL